MSDFEWYAGFEDAARITTHYIIVYHRDGRVEEFDLANPKVPLPRFRALCQLTPTN